MRQILLAATAAAAFPGGLFAAGLEDAPAKPANPEAVTAYAPDFFETFNALTALDMVNRVPGFTLIEGDQVRGFGGAAGNVLLDGERPSSKQSLQTILQRIPASQVERIEYIRGAVSGVDMRGQTEVVNVVRKEGAAASGSYEIWAEAWEDSPVTAGGEASYSGRLKRWDYTVNIARDADKPKSFGFERLETAGGDLVELRDERWREYWRSWESGGEAKADYGPWTLRLNGKGEIWNWNAQEPSIARDADDTFLKLVQSDYDEEGWNGEIGGDVEREFSPTLSAKLIGLKNAEHFESDQRFDLYDSGGFRRATLQSIAQDEGETIVRGFVTWTPNERHSVEMGMEGAFNFLDSDVDLARDDGTGPEIIDIPVSDTRVEEYRGESFISWIWKVSDEWTLEPGFVAEYSRITQSGDGANERSFFFPKPSFTATWTYAPQSQLSLVLEREVSQLDFSDFASSTQVNDDQTNLGNPELEPDKTWRAQLGWQRRFWDDGAVSVEAKYNFIEDLQDYTPISTLDGRRFDAFGNIGDGRQFWAIFKTTLPLDRFGLKNAVADVEANYAKTEVTDPVTGAERNFSGWNDYWWRIDFRQDHPDEKWSWGFDYANSGPWEQYRLNEVQHYTNGQGDLDIFVETTRYFGVTLRADVENIGNAKNRRRREFYDGPRDAGAIEFVETREKSNGVFVKLSLRGTF